MMNVTMDAAAQRQYLHNDLAPKTYTQLENGIAPVVNTDMNKFSTIGPNDSFAHQKKFPNTSKYGFSRPNVVGTDQY